MSTLICYERVPYIRNFYVCEITLVKSHAFTKPQIYQYINKQVRLLRKLLEPPVNIIVIIYNERDILNPITCHYSREQIDIYDTLIKLHKRSLRMSIVITSETYDGASTIKHFDPANNSVPIVILDLTLPIFLRTAE